MRIVLFFLVLIFFLVWRAWIYGQHYEQYTSLEIQGPAVPELALPVYAQFTVTQYMELAALVSVQEIVVPMYLPEHVLPITVRLTRNGELVHIWRHVPASTSMAGVQDVHLSLPVSELLDGSLTLEFDGQGILYDQQNRAPRLFTESFDDAFPHGNYAIAANAKQGDVRLTFIGQQTRWERLRQTHLSSSFQIVSWIGVSILVVFLIVYSPFVWLV